MLEDVSESESEESNSEDDIILAELIEASDCESQQGTTGGSTQRITLSMPATNCGLFFRVTPRKRNFMVSVKSSK